MDFFGIYIHLPGTDCQHTQAKLRWQKEYTFVHFERVCVLMKNKTAPFGNDKVVQHQAEITVSHCYAVANRSVS